MRRSPGRGLGAAAGGFGARPPPPLLAKAPQRAKFAGKAAPLVRPPGAAPAGLTRLSGLIHPVWAGFSSSTPTPEHPGPGWEPKGESEAVQTPASPARSARLRGDAQGSAENGSRQARRADSLRVRAAGSAGAVLGAGGTVTTPARALRAAPSGPGRAGASRRAVRGLYAALRAPRLGCASRWLQPARSKETPRRSWGVLLNPALGPALLQARFRCPAPRYCYIQNKPLKKDFKKRDREREKNP